MSNLLSVVNKELIYEWDFIKNGELGYSFFTITRGVHKRVWWLCPTCESSYDGTIGNRVKGHACPYCTGRRVNHTNSLSIINPELASEWHPVLNGDITANDVTANRANKVWWLGWCGHEWKAPISNRNRYKHGCPYCCNRNVLKGFNDMWTTNPKLAMLLVNPWDGYKYTQGNSTAKLYWECPNCFTISKKRIADVTPLGFSCPSCSDGISYPAKVIFNLLKMCNIINQPEKVFDWLKDRLYDFYLLDFNYIIEVHGEQHYRESGFSSSATWTLKDIQENDKYKYETALKNGIDKYIIINAMISEIGYIRNSIENSYLSKMLNLESVDWEEIDRLSRSSNVTMAVELFEKGFSKKEIAKEIGVHHKTVHRYLRRSGKV